jgi:hypothetical protein
VQVAIGQTYNVNEGIGTLAHHKHWEVFKVLLVRFYYKLQDRVECILVFVIGNSSMTIPTNINTIDLLQQFQNILAGIQEINWDHDNARLFKELDVGFGDVGHVVGVSVKLISHIFILILHITSERFSKHTIDGSPVVRNFYCTKFMECFWVVLVLDVVA